MVNRIGAFLTLCALLSGGTIAPVLDAGAEHRLGTAPAASGMERWLTAASAHDLSTCALVLAATVAPGLPGCVSAPVHDDGLYVLSAPHQSRPRLSSPSFLLPSSRAPPHPVPHPA